MSKIIRKAMVNKRTNQLSITIPKREFKRTNPNLKMIEGVMFELKPIKIKKRNNGGQVI